MSKKALIFILIVVVLGGGYYFFKDSKVFKSILGKNDPVLAGSFSGNANGVSTSELKANGSFLSPPGLVQDVSGKRDVTFVLNASTVYKKTEVLMPSAEFVEASGNNTGVVDIKTFARKESDGSIEDLKKSVSENGAMVNITFDYVGGEFKNIVAKEVAYIVVIMPIIPTPNE